MNKITLNVDFNLHHSISCGQYFQWMPEYNGYIIQTDGKIIYIEQQNNALDYEVIHGRADEVFLRKFFRLDDNLPGIFNHWKDDPILNRSYKLYKGLHLLRQEPWECLVSFLCSAASNIPRITQNIRALSERYGTRVKSGKHTFFLLPDTEQLAKTSRQDLYEAGLGFRAKYLWKTTMMIREGFTLGDLTRFEYIESKSRLKQLPGVGDKIADCVLLFSMDFLESFPTDTWIVQLLQEHYFPDGPKNPIRLASLAREKFGQYAGYAQQYLYHYARSTRNGAPHLPIRTYE